MRDIKWTELDVSGCKSKARHLEKQPCWTGPGQACWLPLEGWQHPSSEKRNNQTYKHQLFLSEGGLLSPFQTKGQAIVEFGTHTGGQQLFAWSPKDVGKVLHEITGGLEHPQHLLVGSRHELEPPHRRQALHVVAVDLRAADFVPRLLWGQTFRSVNADTGWTLPALGQKKESFSHWISFWSSPDCKIYTLGLTFSSVLKCCMLFLTPPPTPPLTRLPSCVLQGVKSLVVWSAPRLRMNSPSGSQPKSRTALKCPDTTTPGLHSPCPESMHEFANTPPKAHHYSERSAL